MRTHAKLHANLNDGCFRNSWLSSCANDTIKSMDSIQDYTFLHIHSHARLHAHSYSTVYTSI